MLKTQLVTPQLKEYSAPPQESFRTWTLDSIVTMTTECHYHNYYMHVITVNQLVYVHLKCMFPTFLVHNG